MLTLDNFVNLFCSEVNQDDKHVAAHRSMPKKSCKEKAAELFDRQLFQPPPAREDCYICMRMLPLELKGSCYQACCGKLICIGCFDSLTRNYCPFCNEPDPTTDDEWNKKLFERIDKFNDPQAIQMLGCCYNSGNYGFPLNHKKAVELFKRASDLGSDAAHYNLGNSYSLGRGLDQDCKKAAHHYQIAAMMGHQLARYNLGATDWKKGKDVRAMRHFTIAAKCGHEDSVEMVKVGFKNGLVTKEDFENTLGCYQVAQDEMRSEDRERAKGSLKVVI